MLAGRLHSAAPRLPARHQSSQIPLVHLRKQAVMSWRGAAQAAMASRVTGVTHSHQQTQVSAFAVPSTGLDCMAYVL